MRIFRTFISKQSDIENPIIDAVTLTLLNNACYAFVYIVFKFFYVKHISNS